MCWENRSGLIVGTFSKKHGRWSGDCRVFRHDFDNDPRRDSEVRDYIRCFSYVVEFRHTVESSALLELYLYLRYEACEVP